MRSVFRRPNPATEVAAASNGPQAATADASGDLSRWLPPSLLASGEQRQAKVGERLLKPDQFSQWVYHLKEGEVRELVASSEGRGPLTLRRLQPGDWFGFADLITGRPLEWVSAVSDVSLEAFPAEQLVPLLGTPEPLLLQLCKQANPSLVWDAIAHWLRQLPSSPPNPDRVLRWLLESAIVQSCPRQQPLQLDDSRLWVLASSGVKGVEPGSQVQPDDTLDLPAECRWPLIVVGIDRQRLEEVLAQAAAPGDLVEPVGSTQQPALIAQAVDGLSRPRPSGKSGQRTIPDAYSLGLRVPERLALGERFQERRAMGKLGQRLAVLEMLALQCKVPFRRDQLTKRLRAAQAADGSLSFQALAALAQQLRLNVRPAEVSLHQVAHLEAPFLLVRDHEPLLVLAVEGRRVVTGDGRGPLRYEPVDELPIVDGQLRVIQVNRHAGSPDNEFNWAWLLPVVAKYRWSLALVLLASLMAQLFTLGIPLLFQQLIDKTLNQGNVSSLNVLAGTMVVFAVLQGLMTALRTFLFVDTTDRIDLTLGSAVMDRLLGLPLGFFEKRPVGELSQRLSELNSLRQFLTGTAITAVMDLLFSSLYIIVLLIYSPSLTAVALSTFPIYLMMTVGVSPIYRRQLRRRAGAQARTQSHLIEMLSGIQTVKAQHGELRSRWKWQDRYQEFVEQGYRSVVLGTSTSQVGSFLNTLSSLLILWVGLRMVLDGQFTLGQLLAFRIIAGYVTAPLLRLSNLWQGIQAANISMERLGDVVNQVPEGGHADADQLALPPVQGAVRFEHVSFRFGSRGPRQLSDVNLSVEAGEFIGIVGLSGSGKSTLMKLLARLYEPDDGRILIDGLDIAKVQLSSLRTQVGMVPQDSLLFEGTVAENIALNNPEIDSEKIVEAAKIACAHDFIMELPEGYASRISERGSNLSGGQRQRLAIARMVLENPAMLVMDEATSALDADTERRVSQNLQERFRNETVFFITHRLATVMQADRIVVMDQGRILEVGSPNDLLSQKGMFHALWTQQS